MGPKREGRFGWFKTVPKWRRTIGSFTQRAESTGDEEGRLEFRGERDVGKSERSVARYVRVARCFSRMVRAEVRRSTMGTLKGDSRPPDGWGPEKTAEFDV